MSAPDDLSAVLSMLVRRMIADGAMTVVGVSTVFGLPQSARESLQQMFGVDEGAFVVVAALNEEGSQ